jgi:hypothetical protein
MTKALIKLAFYWHVFINRVGEAVFCISGFRRTRYGVFSTPYDMWNNYCHKLGAQQIRVDSFIFSTLLGNRNNFQAYVVSTWKVLRRTNSEKITNLKSCVTISSTNVTVKNISGSYMSHPCSASFFLAVLIPLFPWRVSYDDFCTWHRWKVCTRIVQNTVCRLSCPWGQQLSCDNCRLLFHNHAVLKDTIEGLCVLTIPLQISLIYLFVTGVASPADMNQPVLLRQVTNLAVLKRSIIYT